MYNYDHVLTPLERPQHHAIGRYFIGWDQQVYYCDSYDPRVDYWMTNVIEPTFGRRAVSPRAISRTFHHLQDEWKPRVPRAAEGREYFVVDLRKLPGKLDYVPILDYDCFGLDEKMVLFCWDGDARKFIRRIEEAQAKLPAEMAAHAARTPG